MHVMLAADPSLSAKIMLDMGSSIYTKAVRIQSDIERLLLFDAGCVAGKSSGGAFLLLASIWVSWRADNRHQCCKMLLITASHCCDERPSTQTYTGT